MVPSVIGEGEAARTVYVEYMVINGKWETIGDSDVQLVNYYTKSETDAAIEAAVNAFDGGFGDDGLKAYIDAQDDAHQAAAEATASAYTDAQIAAALTGLPEGSKLVAYIDAQDDATSTAAVTAANGYTDAASNTLSAAIVAVDNKFANYYDKDGIAALDYATVTYVDTTSAAAVTEANGYTDQQLANYLDSTAASQAFILRDEIAAPYSHIVYTSQFGSDTFDLHHGDENTRVTVYTTAGADAKFAPISGAELTEVVSITGENAEIAVSKVTATEL